MRSFPDFAEITALAKKPLPSAVVSRGRYVVGTIAALGSLAVFHTGTGTAEAHPHPQRSATPTPAQTAVNSAVPYTIKAGDTLSGIALRHGMSVPSLATVNGINNFNKIIAGQQLLIPVAGATAPAAQQKAAKVTAASVPGVEALGSASGAASPGQPIPALAANNPERARLVPHFREAAAAYNVPAELLMAMTWQESGWQNRAVSSTGAIGVGQLMPQTVDFVNNVLLTKPLDPRVPEQNIRMSAAFLRYLLNETNGDQRLALASYYQGLGAVKRIGLYDDTKAYVRNVFAIQARWF